MHRSLSASSTVRLAAVAAAALFFGWGGLASAQTASDDDETVSTTVRINDLDPTQERDAQILFHRVTSAARQVCGEGEIPINRRAKCAEASAEQAIESLGMPSVTDRYRRMADETPASQAQDRQRAQATGQ
jgi:UrcA family protein